MKTIQIIALTALAGCASAPRPVPAPAPAEASSAQEAPGQKTHVVRVASQACRTGDAMPNGRPENPVAARVRYELPGTPAPMPNACPVRNGRRTTVVVTGTSPGTHP